MTAFSPAARSEPTRSRDDSVSHGLPRGLAIGVTVLSALVYYAVLTHGTFNPLYEQSQGGFAGRYFFAQARAIVDGHLHVAPAQIPAECWNYQGRCYGYFGVTPSILRIPLLPLLDSTNRAFTSVYMTGALTLAVGSALAIASRTLARVQRTPLVTFLMVALAVSLGPASVLAAVARPAVYEEAIAWSVAFALLGVYCFLRWWSGRSRGWGIVLVLSLVLSTNARPTTVALGVVLGVGIALRPLLERRGTVKPWPAVLFGLSVAILPFATCVAVYWLKFDALVPSSLLNQQIGGPNAEPGWLAIRHVDHNQLNGLRFLPTALAAYLRPDGIALTSGFPFARFRFGPLGGTTYLGIPPGSFYVEPFSSIPDDMPFAVVMVIAGLVYGVQTARRRTVGLRGTLAELLRSPLTYCLLGTAGSAAVMMTQGVITNRYLADLFPAIAIAMTLAMRFVAPAAARLSRRSSIVLAGAVTILVVWAVVMNLGLEYGYWWHTTVPGSVAAGSSPP